MEFLQIAAETGAEPCYGCDQEWYGTDWQRRAGCGPTVAATLYYYLFRPDNRCFSQAEWLARMEEVWLYVTPTERGMPTTGLFSESVLSYAAEKQRKISSACCDVPEEKTDRPTLAAVVDFLGSGLGQDAPIAFLNLCNGAETNLHRWHWVTVVGLEYADNGSQALLHTLDEGKMKTVDLACWLDTTALGGGFVYFWPN
jgi:hypothetical protein